MSRERGPNWDEALVVERLPTLNGVHDIVPRNAHSIRKRLLEGRDHVARDSMLGIRGCFFGDRAVCDEPKVTRGRVDA